MKNVFKICALIMFFSTSVGFAQSMDTADKNSEATAVLTDAEADEIKMKVEKKMTAYDADKDSKISVEEASNAESTWLSEYFGHIDKNADGFIDKAELEAKLTKKKLKKKAKPQS